MNVRWILFDAVGTLIYPDPPVAHVYHQVGQQFGSRLGTAEIQHRFHQILATEQRTGQTTSESCEIERWRRIVGQVLHDLPTTNDEAFQRLWQHFAKPQSWRLFDDVAQVLSKLASHDYELGIASNFDGRLLEIVRAKPELAPCQHIFVSSQVGFSKPDLRFFRAVEQSLRAKPSEILLVGDDEVADIQGALNAGWHAAHVGQASRLPGIAFRAGETPAPH